jgi:hypothetical protein
LWRRFGFEDGEGDGDMMEDGKVLMYRNEGRGKR